jgi:hypothetical protein
MCRVVADVAHEHGAVTMRRYFDIRRVGSYVAIVVYDCGEEIGYPPDLRKVDRIADAQKRRLQGR